MSQLQIAASGMEENKNAETVPVGILDQQEKALLNQDNQSIKSADNNSSDIQLAEHMDMESSSISQFSGEVDYRSQEERDWKSEYKLKLFRRDVKKRVNRFFDIVKAILDKREGDVKVRLTENEKVMVNLSNINEVFANHLERKLYDLESQFVKESRERVSLKDDVDDIKTAQVAHNKSIMKLVRRVNDDCVKIDTLESQYAVLASKVDVLEDKVVDDNANNINDNDDNNENLNNSDNIAIPDEPSRVTMRRRSKSTTSGATASPITDAGDMQSTVGDANSDVNEVSVEDLETTREELRSTRKVDKRRVSVARNNAPSDPSSSSSESSNESEKKPKKGKVKKKKRDESSSDEESSSGSDGSDITRGIAALNRDRRSSVFKDIEAEDDSDGWCQRSRRHVGSEVLTLKNLPTMKDLYLDALSVPNLLRFMQKYQTLQQNFHEPLKIANYFKNTILNRVENVARRGKFKDKLRRKGILCNGRQRLSNSQIWSVIKYIVAPKNVEEMKDILRVSVFDVEKFSQYKSEAYIHSNFEEYFNELVNYDKQFLAMLDLATGTKVAKEALPHQVNGGSGKFGQKEKGLVQYYLQGHPNPDFAWRMYTRHSKERDRLAVRTFDDFRDLYFKCLERLEEMIRVEKLSANTFGKESDNSAAKPPRDVRKHNRFKKGLGHRVNAIEEEGDGKVPGEPNGSDESDNDVKESAEGEDTEEEGTEEKQADTEAESNAKEADEDQWLHGMSFGPNGKRPPVCFKFADTGACEYGTKCTYSHNVEDVKAYKAAKLLGPVRVSSISNQYGQRASEGRKDSSGPSKFQPGARKAFDKPSILKRSQDARNHN